MHLLQWLRQVVFHTNPTHKFIINLHPCFLELFGHLFSYKNRNFIEINGTLKLIFHEMVCGIRWKEISNSDEFEKDDTFESKLHKLSGNIYETSESHAHVNTIIMSNDRLFETRPEFKVYYVINNVYYEDICIDDLILDSIWVNHVEKIRR